MMSATYSPEDNALRLYSTSRLDEETYRRVKAAGFQWAPKQDLFKASMWTPAREDLLLELCGAIDDEDISLVERAEERSERFEDYSDKRGQESAVVHARVEQIMDGIPLGQKILVGHHSERHARKDAERIQTGIRKAVDLWQTSQYWQERAAGAIRHAKYKGRPDVRARRIKGLEADLRKQEKNKKEAETKLRLWSKEGLTVEQARQIANFCHVTVCEIDGSRWSAWDVLRPDAERYTRCPAWTVAQVQARVAEVYGEYLPQCQRWIDHLTLRLGYERAMLAGDGGTVADQTAPEKGGAVRCWVCRNTAEWLTIAKVNKVSVTVLDNWGGGGSNFSRIVPFTDLKGVMTVAEVTAKREAGLLQDNAHGTGFYVLDTPVPTAKPAPAPALAPFDVEAAKAIVKEGIQVEVIPKVTRGRFVLTDEVRDILSRADIGGHSVVLPPGQLERKLYEAVDKVLTGLGGKWDKKTRSHRFLDDPRPALEEVLATGQGRTLQQETQLFPTPAPLAARMVDLADIQPGERVLEPSAGTGRILDALRAQCPDATLFYNEFECSLAERLRLKGYAGWDLDFLTMSPAVHGHYDAIVMNPPFSQGAEVAHITHALQFLKPGGRLVAIMSNAITFRRDKAYDALRTRLAEYAGTVEILPDDTFKEEGTSVKTCLLVLRAPQPVATTQPAA